MYCNCVFVSANPVHFNEDPCCTPSGCHFYILTRRYDGNYATLTAQCLNRKLNCDKNYEVQSFKNCKKCFVRKLYVKVPPAFTVA